MLYVRANNPGLWSAVGAGIGTAAGTALGNSPLGLALGAGLGLLFAVCRFRAARPRRLR